MKKNFKFMLVALLALFGFNNAFAQLPAEITSGKFVYTIQTQDLVNKKATAVIKQVAQGQTIVDPTTKELTLGEGEFEYAGEWTVTVKTFAATVTQGNSTATSVVIPAEFTSIPEGAFMDCSNLFTIEFEEGSLVETIGTHAFATTQIANFDFTPCTKLAELPNEVFVEANKPNTYITEVTVPTSPLFKHINGAFQNLTELTTINGLEESWIQEITASAFKNTKIETLSLPGNNLKYIDKDAFKDSKIKILTIDVSELLSLGGGTVGASPEYAWAAEQNGADANLWGFGEVNKTPLESLTLTGTLKGKIAKNAFSWCDKLNTVLDFSGMTFGSTGTIEGEAFATCYFTQANPKIERGILGVTIGDITDNTSGGYTIAADAFKGCTLLSAVTIGDITTANAIGAAAFNNQLKDVTIGTVKASAAAFAGGAFVWKNVSGATLSLATDAENEEYLNSNDATANIIPASTFNMTAITGAGIQNMVWPTIKIGEIRSKGGVFAAGAIAVPTKVKELTFTGAIAANGLNTAIFSADTELTAITFNGAIGAAGIGTGAFVNLSIINTLTFNGLLAEKAVAEGAFLITNANQPNAENPIVYSLNYLCENIPDYTVNPFDKKAFNAAATWAAPAQEGGEPTNNPERFIILNLADTEEGNVPDLLANFQDEAKGLNTNGIFDIYLVLIPEEEDEDAIGFLVYQNQNQKSMAWGRYDLGQFNLEQGPDKDNDGKGDYKTMVQNGMTINRVQTINDQKVKLTLYGLYTDEDPFGQESSIYMVPLQVFNGQYHIDAKGSVDPVPVANQKNLIIVKAETVDGSDFAAKDVLVGFKDEAQNGNDSYWAGMANAPQLEKATAFHTNQQLIDDTWVHDGYTWSNRSVYNEFDFTAVDWRNTWINHLTGKKQDNSDAAAAKKDGKVQQDLWIMTDPAKYKGFRIDKNEIAKGENGTGARIDKGWWFALLSNFGKPVTGAARVIWLDEAQATAIFGVKEFKAVEDGAIYNLQGVRVTNPTKGVYIQNGKKFIVK